MPRKARASGSSPEKQTAATRRNTRRGQKTSDEAETPEVIDEIPAHLLRASDESSEQSDNDSDYGSPKKGRGRAAATTTRGRGRRAKEPKEQPEEKPAPTPRTRRGRRARGSSPVQEEQNSQEEFVESANSQTTTEEHETSTMESEPAAPEPEVVEEKEKTPEPEKEVQQNETIVQQSEPTVESSPKKDAEVEEKQPPPPSPPPQQQQPEEEEKKEEEEEDVKQPESAEKVSEVIEQDQSNNDQATVNEEVNDDKDRGGKDDDHDDEKREVGNDEKIEAAAESNENVEAKEAAESSPEVVNAEDEMSKDAPEISMEVDQSDSRSRSRSNSSERPRAPERKRSRSSSGEIREDSCDKVEPPPKKEEKKEVSPPRRAPKVERTPIKPPEPTEEPQKPATQRKRKWGARKADDEPVIAITTDSLANIIAEEVKPVPLSDVKLDASPSPEPEEKRARVRLSSEDRDAKKKLLKERLKKQEEEEERRNEQMVKAFERSQTSPTLVVTNGAGKDRKVALVSGEGEPEAKAPTPPKNQISRVLCITNLVRPLTFMAVKSLVSRTGELDDFWIDSIKSKCFVKYKTEDEASETRHALHGVKWPEHNLKTLNVEFSTDEEMARVVEATVGERYPAVAVAESRESKPADKGFGWSKSDVSAEDRSRTSRRVREWDVGKKEETEHDEGRERRRRRSSERENRRDKERKPLDESIDKQGGSPRRDEKEEGEIPSQPGRLLDDLFRKTKAVPCIYWLPLSEDQIKEKEEQRQKNIAEHSRRMEVVLKAQKERREQRMREMDKERERRREEREKRDRERNRSKSRSRSRRRERRSVSRDRIRRYDRR